MRPNRGDDNDLLLVTILALMFIVMMTVGLLKA